jgi:hypothetical protein
VAGQAGRGEPDNPYRCFRIEEAVRHVGAGPAQGSNLVAVGERRPLARRMPEATEPGAAFAAGSSLALGRRRAPAAQAAAAPVPFPLTLS